MTERGWVKSRPQARWKSQQHVIHELHANFGISFVFQVVETKGALVRLVSVGRSPLGSSKALIAAGDWVPASLSCLQKATEKQVAAATSKPVFS